MPPKKRMSPSHTSNLRLEVDVGGAGEKVISADSNAKGPRKRRVTFRNVKPALRYALWRFQRKVRDCNGKFNDTRKGKTGMLPGLMFIICFGAIATLLGLLKLIWYTNRSSIYQSREFVPRYSASLDKFRQKPHTFMNMNVPKRTLNTERPNSADPPILLNRFQDKDAFYQAPISDINSYNPHYGGLNIAFLGEHEHERNIQPDPEAFRGHVWESEEFEENSLRWDNYHSFDDEYQRNEQFREQNLQCRYNAWHRNIYPTCNTFHEIEIIKGKNKFLGGGAFRAAFLQHEPFDPTLVVKVQLYDDSNPFDIERFEFVRNDALIMERLTASPRIADIYGHCASSIYSEFLPNEAEEQIIPGEGDGIDPPLNDTRDVDPKNKYDISEKLDLALQMAESIADLHGYQGGVIVHDDIQLAQFLFKKDGSLVLNDFNRGETMLFDEKKGGYCRYTNGKGGGEYRSPEEYKDVLLNEKIDVWSYGNNIYGLITGLWVFYHTEDDTKAKMKMMVDGELAYLDPRYIGKNYIQDKLIDLMYRCWAYDPDKRADIFEAVTTLRDVVKEGKKLGIYNGRF